MDELFQQLDAAYEQTGTDFYEDYYGSETDGLGPTPAEQTDEFLAKLNCQGRVNRPRTFKQMHPKKKTLINWKITYFDSINNS